MPTIDTADLVRQQLARGMSEEALRRAMGIRPRDWPGTKVLLAGAAAEPAPPADIAKDRTWAAHEDVEPRETAGQRKRRELLEREAQRQTASLARQEASEIKRQQRQQETLRRQAERRQREEARKAAHLNAIADREKRRREKLERREKVRDEVFAKGRLLADIVMQAASEVPGVPPRSLSAAAVNRYIAWTVRTHVPQISAGEIASLLGWVDGRRVTRAVDLIHVQLQTPTFQPALAALHARVRALMQADHRCASCDAISGV